MADALACIRSHHEGWTYTLHEAKEDDELEAHQLRKAPSNLQPVLHVSIKLQDSGHSCADAERRDDLDPQVAILGSKRLNAVHTSRLSCLQDDNGKQLRQRVLEDEDPGDAWPVAVEHIAFFGRFDSIECLVVECASWSSKLDVQQEECTQTECLVEVAEWVEIRCGIVAEDLEEGDNGKDEWSKDQSNDLSLLFGASISTKVIEDECHGDEEGDRGSGSSYVEHRLMSSTSLAELVRILGNRT